MRGQHRRHTNPLAMLFVLAAVTTRIMMPWPSLVLTTVGVLVLVPTVHAIHNDYDEFVKEVLEEDTWHHDEDSPYYEDPPPNFHHQDDDENEQEDLKQQRQRRKREEERLKQQAEVDRAQRQAVQDAFERELATLSPEQQKLVRQKKRHDSMVVQRILHAWQKHDYYAVLGLRWRGWFFPEGIRLIRGRGDAASKNKNKKFLDVVKDAIFKRQWPDWIVFRIPTRAIQQAYRIRCVAVHPDKNRDPRTEQAFVAVQDAHAVLVDPVLRQEYAEERRQHRIAVRQAWKDRYEKVMQKTLRPFWLVIRKVLGPLTVPLAVIGALVF